MPIPPHTSLSASLCFQCHSTMTYSLPWFLRGVFFLISVCRNRDFEVFPCGFLNFILCSFLSLLLWLWSLEARKDHSRTGKDEKKRKTQGKMERGSRKRSSSAGSEKMERQLELRRRGITQKETNYRWRELVADVKKWKNIFRQAKAHSRL